MCCGALDDVSLDEDGGRGGDVEVRRNVACEAYLGMKPFGADHHFHRGQAEAGRPGVEAAA